MFQTRPGQETLESRRISRGARVFFAPIIFHFAVVVVVSAVVAG
ncbi:MAG TPA: hypothetical protein VE046_01720 [Steroidobacteraceae bacterium]|nr:hypothetical protein [Steroidobacteraceae bacterium]